MALEKQIADQIKRVEALQKDLIGRPVGPEDAKRPEELKKNRIAGVRDAINRLQTEKKATVERYDAEISSLEKELKTLEKPTDIDLAARQSGGFRGKVKVTKNIAAAAKRSPAKKTD